jgi:hypothetical protein
MRPWAPCELFPPAPTSARSRAYPFPLSMAVRAIAASENQINQLIKCTLGCALAWGRCASLLLSCGGPQHLQRLVNAIVELVHVSLRITRRRPKAARAAPHTRGAHRASCNT